MEKSVRAMDFIQQKEGIKLGLFDLATRIADAIPPELTDTVIEKLEYLPPEELKQAFLSIYRGREVRP